MAEDKSEGIALSETGGVALKIDVIRDKDIIIPALNDLFKYSSNKSQEERNQAYVEQAIQSLVLPIWRDLPNKENDDFLNKIDGNRRNTQLTGRNIGINSRNFEFVNSVALGENAFRLARAGVISGSLIIGDNALKGNEFGRSDYHDAHGQKIEPEQNIIENSVVFGAGALRNAIRGEIRHSIIAGPSDLLTKAFGVKLIDTYVVTPQGTLYFKEQVLSGKGLVNIPSVKQFTSA